MRALIDYRPALRQRTGVGEWVHSLAEALAADPGPDAEPLAITLFASSWKDRLTSPPAPIGLELADCRVPVRVLNFAWHRLGAPPVEWLTGQRYDVVHSPHPLLIPSRHGARIVTIHDLDFLDRPDGMASEVRRDYPALVRDHATRATRVIVPSRHTASEVESRLQVPADRITVCYNGAPDWPRRRDATTGDHILFVGSLVPRKNVEGLVAAYRQLVSRDAGGDVPPLVLAGAPPRPAPAWLAQLSEPPLRDRVRCTGYVDRAQLRRLYETARMLVLPSHHEGFGLPVVEAMTVGVPVIVSDRGALPEVVGDAGLVVDPDDHGALADAMARRLADPVLARRSVERGFVRAAGFRWRESARALRAAYRQAMKDAA